MKIYDKEAVYDAEIAPLMEKIIQVCKDNGIPMAASFAYANSEEQTSFCTTILNRFPDQHVPQYDELFQALKRRNGLVAITITKP